MAKNIQLLKDQYVAARNVQRVIGGREASKDVQKAAAALSAAVGRRPAAARPKGTR